MARSPEQKFLQQARKGAAFWRLQRVIAYAVAALFALGSVWRLWSAYVAVDRGLADLLSIVSFVAAGVAAGMWQVHSELMLGAAVFLGKQAPEGRP